MNLRFLDHGQSGRLKFQIQDQAQGFADAGAVRLDQELVGVHFSPGSLGSRRRLCLERVDVDTQQRLNGLLNRIEPRRTPTFDFQL